MTKSLDMMKCSKSICLLKNKILTLNWHIVLIDWLDVIYSTVCFIWNISFSILMLKNKSVSNFWERLGSWIILQSEA